MSQKYIIREVEERDLQKLQAIEQQRWSREGTAILPLQTLQEWFRSKSPYFLVAEKNEEIYGFYYGMQVHFSLGAIEEFTGADARKNQGYTDHVHTPEGTSVYGVNVVTIAPEVGMLLNAEVHRRVFASKAEYFLGFTRLVHLDHYLKSLEAANSGKLPYNESEIALWYAHQTMKKIGAYVWQECSKEPILSLPPPRRSDTILRYHVEGTLLGLLRVVPNYMHDPKSRSYGAFIASKWPHIPQSH